MLQSSKIVKMKFSIVVAASALATGVSASIVSIQIPQTIALGKVIPVKLVNNIDQSSTYETSITFGLGTTPSDPNIMIGTPVSSIYLRGKLPAAAACCFNSDASRRYSASCTFYKKHKHSDLGVG